MSIRIHRGLTRRRVLTTATSLAAATLGDVVNIVSLNQPPPRTGPGPGPAPGGLPPQFGTRFFTPPPPGETRFVQNEVVLQQQKSTCFFSPGGTGRAQAEQPQRRRNRQPGHAYLRYRSDINCRASGAAAALLFRAFERRWVLTAINT